MARRFHETSYLVSSVKSEPRSACETRQEDTSALVDDDLFLVSAELNQSSNAVEILDDLPRQLIPGIDF